MKTGKKITQVGITVILLLIYSAYKTQGTFITKITAFFIYAIVLAIILSYTIERLGGVDSSMFVGGGDSSMMFEDDGSILFIYFFVYDYMAFQGKLSLFLILLFAYLSYRHKGTILGLFCIFILLYGIYYRIRVYMMTNSTNSRRDRDAYIESVKRVKRVKILSLIITVIVIYMYLKHYKLYLK
jgi:hypothetical protein